MLQVRQQYVQNWWRNGWEKLTWNCQIPSKKRHWKCPIFGGGLPTSISARARFMGHPLDIVLNSSYLHTCVQPRWDTDIASVSGQTKCGRCGVCLGTGGWYEKRDEDPRTTGQGDPATEAAPAGAGYNVMGTANSLVWNYLHILHYKVSFWGLWGYH